MIHQKIGVRLIVISVTVMLCGTIGVLFLSGDASAWSAGVYFGPTTVSAGDTVDFEVTITNEGSSSMEITWIGVHFDWMDEGYYYVSDDVSDSNPYVLGRGDSATFYIYGVPIPNGITTNTYHSFEIEIYAADPGIINEWGTPYSQTYDGSVFVEEPTYNVYGYVVDENTGDPIWGATVSIGSYTATTDSTGYYSISGIKEGTYTISVDADGYQSSSKVITINEDTEVDFSLYPINSGGTSGGSSDTSGGTNTYFNSPSNAGWLLPLAILIVAIIIIIAAAAIILSKSKKKNNKVTLPPVQSISESQKNTKFCPYCGREIPPDAQICPYCGNTLK